MLLLIIVLLLRKRMYIMHSNAEPKTKRSWNVLLIKVMFVLGMKNNRDWYLMYVQLLVVPLDVYS